MKNLKMGDILIYVFLVLFTLVGFWGIKSMANIDGERSVVVLIDGEEIERIEIKPNMEPRQLKIDAKDERFNVINISDEGIHVVEASCLDRLCIKQGIIEYPGQSIVCLPNRVVIKIVGDDNRPAVDDITYLGGGL